VLLASCAPAAPPPAAPPAAPAPAKPAEQSKTAAPAAPAAPAAKQQPAAPAAPAKTAEPSAWVVAVTEDATALDPGTGSSVQGTANVQAHIFEPLVSYEGHPFKLTPRLAESWQVTEGRIWEFKIRQGVKFHDGQTLTAKDVKYSIDAHRDEKAPRKTYSAGISSVEELDQYTVRITTDSPTPGLMANLAQLLIMPRDGREKVGAEKFAEAPVGTGPFKLVEFVRGERLVLEAYQDYWRGEVFPKKLTLRPIPDPATRVAELKSGGAQIIASPALAQVAQLQQGDTELALLKGGRVIIYPFNPTKKPFDDPRVRQAVNYAVNRDAIIKSIIEGYAEPLHGPFASAWLGYDESLKTYPYDPAKAKELLTQAGYPNGFETDFNITSGVFLKDREISEAVAENLAEVGIKVRLLPTERAKIQSDWINGTFDGITSVAWGTAADPDPMLSWAFAQRKVFESDQKLRGYVDQSKRTIDPEERRKVLQEFGRYVHDQAYWMFIHAQDEFYAKRKEIAWQPIPDGQSFATVQLYRVAPRS
jgi:peptide/nickel transport system substrate-binding protein